MKKVITKRDIRRGYILVTEGDSTYRLKLKAVRGRVLP